MFSTRCIFSLLSYTWKVKQTKWKIRANQEQLAPTGQVRGRVTEVIEGQAVHITRCMYRTAVFK